MQRSHLIIMWRKNETITIEKRRRAWVPSLLSPQYMYLVSSSHMCYVKEQSNWKISRPFWNRLNAYSYAEKFSFSWIIYDSITQRFFKLHISKMQAIARLNTRNPSELNPIKRLWAIAKRRFGREAVNECDFSDKSWVKAMIEKLVTEVPKLRCNCAYKGAAKEW